MAADTLTGWRLRFHPLSGPKQGSGTRGRVKRAGILLLLILTGPAWAGAQAPDVPPRYNGPLAAAVFASALAFMAPRTLENVKLADLTLWGLRGLTSLDPDLTPSVGAQVLLSNSSRILFAARAPKANDAAGWGDVAALMAQAAWASSAFVRQAGTQGIIESFFDELFNHLDPYSRYVAPAEAAADQAEREGTTGAGLTFAIRSGRVVIVTIAPSGPAAAAGLMVGAIVTTINGIAVTADNAARAAALLRGPLGTRLVLRYRPPGGSERSAMVVRARIPPHTVFSRRRGRLLVLRITGFGRDTGNEFADALLAGITAANPPAGVVIDLRGNRGGLLSQAVRAAGTLVPGGVIARTVGRDPVADHVWFAHGADLAQGLPVVVLVDGRTASAAEVLAAALADLHRAVVVGSATLGKGLVQTITPLPDGGELYVTWSRLLAPLGWPLDGLGVMPQLCTSNGELALEHEMAALNAGHEPLAGVLRESRAARATLPLAEILAIRSACPAALGSDLDLVAARFLITDAAAYASAILPFPPRP